MNIGIFGGTFDPPHKGHKRALDAFIDTCRIDTALVIPAFLPPHKEKSNERASFCDRMAMAEIAFGKRDNVIVSNVEEKLFFENGEKSYTAVTVRRIKQSFSGRLYLYVGTDMFLTLDSWREPEFLFENTVIAVMSRDGNTDVLLKKKREYEERFNASVVLIDAPFTEVSSTEIRQKLKDDRVLQELDDEVLDYIKENKLYKPRASREALIETVRSRLTEKRFAHTMAVETEAKHIAGALCPDLLDAVSSAALLHDVTKPFSPEEHIAYAKTAGITLTEDDLKSPETLHALTGAAFARLSLGEDRFVARLINSHTTGDENMSIPEMIIFLADYIEPTRKHTACIEERERFLKEFDSAETYEKRANALYSSVLRVLRSTTAYLEGKGVFVHPRTLKAAKHLETLINEERNGK